MPVFQVQTDGAGVSTAAWLREERLYTLVDVGERHPPDSRRWWLSWAGRRPAGS
ncbi:MAG: hypothetical protein INH41_22035 [Myxococcaceae bacterium]|nr:hypothetical protein [Myxococcaceae bacterium]MCA3015075.1 hypothetical protein [Myxococcaceae bacterium]